MKVFGRRSIHREVYSQIDENIRNNVFYSKENDFKGEYRDEFNTKLVTRKYLSQLSPSKLSNYQQFNRQKLGFYLPKGWFLTLGDNRDNSRDSRSFGLINKSKIMGQGYFIFWPLNRIGKVE